MTKIIHEKRRIFRRLYSVWVIIVLLIILFVLLRGVWGVYNKEAESGDNLANANQDLQVLKNREAELEDLLGNLETKRGVEAEIVKKFNVAKEGEDVVYIIGEEVIEPEPVIEEKTFWQKLRRFFSGE